MRMAAVQSNLPGVVTSSQSPIHAALDFFDARQDGSKRRHVAEDHAGHCNVIGAQCIAHRMRGHEREGSSRCRFKAEVVASEEEACMGRAVRRKCAVLKPCR